MKTPLDVWSAGVLFSVVSCTWYVAALECSWFGFGSFFLFLSVICWMIQSLSRIAHSEIVPQCCLGHKNSSVKDTGRIPSLSQIQIFLLASSLLQSVQLHWCLKLFFCSVLGMWVPAGQAIGKYIIWDQFWKKKKSSWAWVQLLWAFPVICGFL